MVQTPILYSPDVEDVKPDEAETITKLNETFDTILERRRRITATPCARSMPKRTASLKER